MRADWHFTSGEVFKRPGEDADAKHAKMNQEYGIEHFGVLKKVMLHRPDETIRLVTEENMEFFLFDRVPEVDGYLEEHQRYQDLLTGLGVEVCLLADHVIRNRDLLLRLPNLAYLHDIAVISSYGSIISKMSTRGRCHEEVVVREALEDLGIPTLYEPADGAEFEGCLLVSPSTVFVADTERHNRNSIKRFIEFILNYFDEVIYAVIPQERRFMHPDMVLNRVTEHLMLYYPQAFLKTYHISKNRGEEIDLRQFMKDRKVSLIPVSDDEQKRWGCSFVPLKPGEIINYDISLEDKTVNLLEREGICFIHFHPQALLAGGGSLRCLTLRIWRT